MNDKTGDPGSSRTPANGSVGTPPAPETSREGDLAQGVGFAWLIAVFGHVLLIILSFALGSHLSLMSLLFLLVLPEMAIVVMAIVFQRKGQSRTARGALLGLASILALALLLMAACFGLFALGNGYSS